MRMNLTKLMMLIFLLFLNFNILLTQDEPATDDEEITEDEYVEEDEDYDMPDWKYLWVDVGYGGSGPGFGMGFRYWHLGVSFEVTGFANTIPKTTANITGDITGLPLKYYPSTVVCGDFWGFYDMKKFTLFANLGYYSSIDSARYYDESNGAYYDGKAKTNAGLTFGGGIQAPLTFINEENKAFNQLVAGIGYHSQLGLLLRIAYRW